MLGLTPVADLDGADAAPPLGGWLIGHGLLGSWAFAAAIAAALGSGAERWGSGRVTAASLSR